jgi:4-aminobutyrate aminotransferase-like enzyme
MKDAHGSVVRISPPLCATEADIDFLCDALEATLGQVAS